MVAAAALCSGVAAGALFAAAPSHGSVAGPAPANPELGKTLFRATCGACHSLTAAGTEATLGPDLNAVPPLDEAAIAALIAKGDPTVGEYPSAMPGFADQLSAGQIDDVAAFVYAAMHPSAIPPPAAPERVTVTVGKPKPASCLPSKKSVRAGRVVFEVVNRGTASVVFQAGGKKTRRISPGKKATLTVSIAKVGRYTFACKD